MAKFRDAVKNSTQSEESVLVVSYNRKALGQTGSGHFSPIGGYEPSTDRVLIMDVARFKYPPHWTKLPLLYTAMTGLDTVSPFYCRKKDSAKGCRKITSAVSSLGDRSLSHLSQTLCIMG